MCNKTANERIKPLADVSGIFWFMNRPQIVYSYYGGRTEYIISVGCFCSGCGRKLIGIDTDLCPLFCLVFCNAVRADSGKNVLYATWVAIVNILDTLCILYERQMVNQAGFQVRACSVIVKETLLIIQYLNVYSYQNAKRGLFTHLKCMKSSGIW